MLSAEFAEGAEITVQLDSPRPAFSVLRGLFRLWWGEPFLRGPDGDRLRVGLLSAEFVEAAEISTHL